MTAEDLKAMAPIVGEDGVEVYSFEKYVYSPPGGFGVITLDREYRKVSAQDAGTDVGVGMDILAVTHIDSLDKAVGLKILFTLEWEDKRLQWPLGTPQLNQEWEFDAKILK